MDAEIVREYRAFCRSVKNLRTANNLSEDTMAAFLGIDTDSLYKLEHGNADCVLTCEVIVRVCRVFDVHPTVLFTVEEA